MPSALNNSERTRALAALKDAQQFIQGVTVDVGDDARTLLERVRDESRKLHQASMSFVLALLKDEYAPAELFKPWASKRRIRQWRDDPKVKLDVRIIHGRLSVRPSAFFALWNTLPDETKRSS